MPGLLVLSFVVLLTGLGILLILTGLREHGLVSAVCIITGVAGLVKSRRGPTFSSQTTSGAAPTARSPD